MRRVGKRQSSPEEYSTTSPPLPPFSSSSSTIQREKSPTLREDFEFVTTTAEIMKEQRHSHDSPSSNAAGGNFNYKEMVEEDDGEDNLGFQELPPQQQQAHDGVYFHRRGGGDSAARKSKENDAGIVDTEGVELNILTRGFSPAVHQHSSKSSHLNNSAAPPEPAKKKAANSSSSSGKAHMSDVSLANEGSDDGVLGGGRGMDQRSSTHASNLHPATFHKAEPSLVLLMQVLVPFIVAGVGMVLAGLCFDAVANWPLFKLLPEAFILVPALLGLKGNLEMTLASRLSTMANTGQMSTSLASQQHVQISGEGGSSSRNAPASTGIISANLALVQVQAIVVTLLASVAAVALAWIPRGQFNASHAVLLCASSLATASTASLLLSVVMVAVVVGAKRAGVNPDNIATPIAASLGDLTTIAVLACYGSLFLRAHNTEPWLNAAVIVAFVAALPLFISTASKNPTTAHVLREGWSPIIFSMLISSSGGFVLERAMRRFSQVALYQPVINGVGGNLAAVHASRLSTSFHQSSFLGMLPHGWTVERFAKFRRAFFSSDWDARSARVLLFLVVPGHIFFNWLIGFLHAGENPSHTAFFTALYLLAALTQVTILLFACQWLVALMWHWGVDPDNAAIPYLTALGDLVGTSLLFIVFTILAQTNEPGVKLKN